MGLPPASSLNSPSNAAQLSQLLGTPVPPAAPSAGMKVVGSAAVGSIAVTTGLGLLIQDGIKQELPPETPPWDEPPATPKNWSLVYEVVGASGETNLAHTKDTSVWWFDGNDYFSHVVNGLEITNSWTTENSNFSYSRNEPMKSWTLVVYFQSGGYRRIRPFQQNIKSFNLVGIEFQDGEFRERRSSTNFAPAPPDTAPTPDTQPTPDAPPTPNNPDAPGDTPPPPDQDEPPPAPVPPDLIPSDNPNGLPNSDPPPTPDSPDNPNPTGNPGNTPNTTNSPDPINPPTPDPFINPPSTDTDSDTDADNNTDNDPDPNPTNPPNSLLTPPVSLTPPTAPTSTLIPPVGSTNNRNQQLTPPAGFNSPAPSDSPNLNRKKQDGCSTDPCGNKLSNQLDKQAQDMFQLEQLLDEIKEQLRDKFTQEDRDVLNSIREKQGRDSQETQDQQEKKNNENQLLSLNALLLILASTKHNSYHLAKEVDRDIPPIFNYLVSEFEQQVKKLDTVDKSIGDSTSKSATTLIQEGVGTQIEGEMSPDWQKSSRLAMLGSQLKRDIIVNVNSLGLGLTRIFQLVSKLVNTFLGYGLATESDLDLSETDLTLESDDVVKAKSYEGTNPTVLADDEPDSYLVSESQGMLDIRDDIIAQETRLTPEDPEEPTDLENDFTSAKNNKPSASYTGTEHF